MGYRLSEFGPVITVAASSPLVGVACSGCRVSIAAGDKVSGRDAFKCGEYEFTEWSHVKDGKPCEYVTDWSTAA
jgi:hypothetical protein